MCAVKPLTFRIYIRIYTDVALFTTVQVEPHEVFFPGCTDRSAAWEGFVVIAYKIRYLALPVLVAYRMVLM